MPYSKEILRRVDRLPRPEKRRFNVYLTVAVYAEFQRKCGDRRVSVVLEEMIKTFNETKKK